MKMSMKKVMALGLAALLIAAASGCTGSGGKTDPDEKITITLWNKVPADADENVQAAVTSGTERLRAKFPHLNIEVKNISTGTDYRQDYDKALMAGNAPTIFDEFSYNDIPTRIKNGTIADITEFVENWELRKEGKVLTTFDSAISSDGNWYAIPAGAYVQAMLVNKKAIKDGGGNPDKLPTTWAEFAAMGALITDKTVPRYGYELVGMDWCAWPFTAWVWSAGGEMVRPNGDGTYRVAFNESAGVDAAMFINEMIWKHGMTQKNILISYEDIMNDVMTGAAAFSWASVTNLHPNVLPIYDLTCDDFTMTPMPVKDSSITRPALSGGNVITFNPKASKEVLAAAFEVAEYMYYDEENLIASWEETNATGVPDLRIPARADLVGKKLSMNSAISDELRAVVVSMNEAAIAEPFCMNWTDLKSQLVNPLQEIYLTENITREKAQALLDGCANEIYRLYPNAFKK